MLNLDYQTSPRNIAISQPIPNDVAFSEIASRQFRTYLESLNLTNYRIFHANFNGLFGIDRILTELDPAAVWETDGISLVTEESITPLTFGSDTHPPRAWPSGFLQLKKLQIVIARWYWVDLAYGGNKAIFLIAAPSPESVDAFRKRVIELNHDHNECNWQIVDDHGSVEYEDRIESTSYLLIDPSVQNRLETEVLGFFSPRVQQMYERLGVPYRRGVLMYGAPGNGKTSIIRNIAAKLPHVSALLCRPASEFNTSSLIELLKLWKDSAPAILVLEDIDHVLERVNTSTFLNMLDGVDQKISGGLLLIGTTNHPEKLDSALSNRPGRFDVVIEVPIPTFDSRQLYFSARLLELDSNTIRKLAEGTERMSFAHLEEIIRSSGMIALREGRDIRTAADVMMALAQAQEAQQAAECNFLVKPEMPFGLTALRDARK